MDFYEQEDTSTSEVSDVAEYYISPGEKQMASCYDEDYWYDHVLSYYAIILRATTWKIASELTPPVFDWGGRPKSDCTDDIIVFHFIVSKLPIS